MTLAKKSMSPNHIVILTFGFCQVGQKLDMEHQMNVSQTSLNFLKMFCLLRSPYQ